MTTLRTSPLLAFALRLDAVATALCAIPMLAVSREMASYLGLPTALLVAAGSFMLAYAAVVGWLGFRATLPRWTVWTVIVGNALWAIDCALLAFTDLVAPTAMGVAFLVVQTAIVLGFAELQFLGMKRSPAAATVTAAATATAA